MLTADLSGIADADGLSGVTFSYQWMADDTNIQDATGSSYTLTEDDEGKAITVTVSFTDAEGNPETLTSDPTGEVEAKPNTSATGVPTIDGTAQVGQTLTAETSGIADEDGLDNVTFSYQWMAADTNIQDATGSSYTLTEDDEGKTITVTVSFSDAEGNPETLTSDPTGEVAAKPNIQATGLPTISGTVRVGETLTADVTAIADGDGLTNVVFSYQWLADDVEIAGAIGSGYTLTKAEQGKTVTVTVSFTDDAGHAETLTSAVTDAVEVVEVTVQPATELALPVSITRSDWRWDSDEPHHTVNIDFTIHEDPGDTVGSGIYFMLGFGDLGGTTWYAGLQTNVLRPGEGGVGKGFIFSRWDTRSLDHTRPTEAGWTESSGHEGDFVGVRHPYPWTTGSYTVKIGPDASGNGWYGAWITEHNGGEITWLGSLRFEEEEGHGRVLISVLEAYGKPIKMVDIPLSKITIEPPHNERGERPTSVSFLHSGTATNHDIEYDEVTGQVTFTAGGNTVLRNIHSQGSQYQVPSAEVTHNPNSPATGPPTISGAALVGQTLTADTSGIADEDGLDNVTFSYQWMADDANIQGATDRTYTLADRDEGKAIKVIVSFTDDANNEESLPSAATGAVAALPGKPQSLAGKATAQEIKLNWKAPTGPAVVEYVVYRGTLQNGSMNGQALSKYATIDAAGKAMAYTDDNVEEGVEYRYRVAAVNSDGEGKKSTWLDITAEEPSP